MVVSFSSGIFSAALQEKCELFSRLVFFTGIGYTAHVNSQSRTIHGSGDPFASTHWSVIVAAGHGESEPAAAQAALAQLCQTYWAPLYTFVRKRGHSAHDAEDLTQSFFAWLLEDKIYLRADSRKGKFRSFLLNCLKDRLADAYDHKQALKRGGGSDPLPLNEAQVETAESLFQTHGGPEDSPNEDRLFERAWAETLVAAALKRTAAHYRDENKKKLFEELKVFVTGGTTPLPTYSDLAERLSVQASTLRGEVTRLRARYREGLRVEVRQTVESEAEVAGELRELLRVLTDG